MVYLGPIIRLTPVIKTRPATGYEPDRDLLIDKQLPEHLPPVYDRRRGDRRKQRGKPTVLDTRSDKDRRRSPPRSKIDIEV